MSPTKRILPNISLNETRSGKEAKFILLLHGLIGIELFNNKKVLFPISNLPKEGIMKQNELMNILLSKTNYTFNTFDGRVIDLKLNKKN